MNFAGEYRSLAQYVDGPPHGSPGWVPGVDFDPADPDQMQVMALVFDAERQTELTRLTRENDQLRQRVAELEAARHEGSAP